MLDFAPGALHGQEHIRAGVAIGHGENVEGIDARLVVAQPQQAGLHQPLQTLPVHIEQFLGSILRFGSH